MNYLPSPMDIPPAKGIIPQTGQTEERTPDPNGPFAGLAFKIQTDPHVGRLTYVRIYSGKLKAGSYLQKCHSTGKGTCRPGFIDARQRPGTD